MRGTSRRSRKSGTRDARGSADRASTSVHELKYGVALAACRMAAPLCIRTESARWGSRQWVRGGEDVREITVAHAANVGDAVSRPAVRERYADRRVVRHMPLVPIDEYSTRAVRGQGFGPFCPREALPRG